MKDIHKGGRPPIQRSTAFYTTGAGARAETI